MNSEKSSQILIHHAVQSGKHLIGNSFICQPDNDPKLTAKAVKHTSIEKKNLMEHY